jgi:hypothetical protein
LGHQAPPSSAQRLYPMPTLKLFRHSPLRGLAVVSPLVVLAACWYFTSSQAVEKDNAKIRTDSSSEAWGSSTHGTENRVTSELRSTQLEAVDDLLQDFNRKVSQASSEMEAHLRKAGEILSTEETKHTVVDSYLRNRWEPAFEELNASWALDPESEDQLLRIASDRYAQHTALRLSLLTGRLDHGQFKRQVGKLKLRATEEAALVVGPERAQELEQMEDKLEQKAYSSKKKGPQSTD